MLEGPTRDAPQHPLRVSTSLPHPFAPWQDLTIDGYIAHSLGKWQTFVDQAQRTETISMCDGLLFHGNMADLLLMNAAPDILRGYVARVLACLEILQPVVIYLQHPDVAEALRAVRDERGRERQAYQVNWKVTSPFGVQRSLHGFDGLVQLYQEYRALCDDIFAALTVPKLAIVREGNWPRYRRDILEFLQPFFSGLPRAG
ncbi:MAG: hypothetical protein HYX51_01950 [Chloroflexi bacterium]|nr:hypothetical protein [Chloroflexota bacterium]